MTQNTLQIVIGGEAGQGLVTAGEALAKVLMRSGYHIFVAQDYRSRIRGGHNSFAVRASITPVCAPQETVDVLVALDEVSVASHQSAVSQNGGVVILPAASSETFPGSLRVPYPELAGKRYEAVTALGVAAALIGLDPELAAEVISFHFKAKEEAAVAQESRSAVNAGYAWARRVIPAVPPRLPPAVPAVPRLMMNGNEALALGALAAGVRFCAFYPMTPATSVVMNLIKHADALGVVVEQAEDEIAAANMILGAAYAGARSMTATSGGGFALMTEAVSLTAATELPAVFVIAQRPGPATGLPTRTEQSDLELVLYAGHGEFPRAVFTPGSVETCFRLMREAFDCAEASQGPVFLLTDQCLAHSYRDILPLDLGEAQHPPSPPAADGGQEPYLPYAQTESGVSPRLLPCAGEQLVIADSHEHTADGHVTEDPGERVRMVDKRLRKLAVLKDRAVPPEYRGGEAPELLLVSWGSSKGAVEETAERLNAEGQPAATLHFDQVWPLCPDQFLGRLKSARRTVCVEGNATHQFARLIRSETGFAFAGVVSRYDGRPFTPEYILERLRHET